MVGTITRETKREDQRKVKRRPTHNNKKKRKELVPFMVGSYFIHNPSNVTCMQIKRFNNNWRFRTRIICQCNFPLYSRGYITLKINTNMLPEKLNAKIQG